MSLSELEGAFMNLGIWRVVRKIIQGIILAGENIFCDPFNVINSVLGNSMKYLKICQKKSEK